MHPRRRAREVALQVLYALDVLKNDPDQAIELFWKNFDAPEESREFSSALILGAWSHRDRLDNHIIGCSEHWAIHRMPRVDRSILRIAIYELFYCPDIPPKVTINEAIDLGKIYGSENSSSFINGILDAVYLKLRSDHADNNLDHPDRQSTVP
ncbi:MAG: transcription antitermination factor NusB [Smithellaceae bacterium]|nr:transcription antitermination factor NusB [Smithellaceae bacterium]